MSAGDRVERSKAKEREKGKENLTLWERLERPSPTARTPLNPRRIAEAAVEIADQEGLDAVTMRRLATALGVAPMAAYRYVSSKDELLELMVDHVYGEVDLSPARSGWRQVMRELAVHLLEVGRRHPWVTRVGWFGLTPNQIAVPEAALAALGAEDLDADTAMAVYSTVTSYVSGALDAEIGLTRMLESRGWASYDEARSGLAPQMAWLVSTGRYPMYARYLGEATRKGDLQWQFEIGLDCVLDGVATRLKIADGATEDQ
ncbi:TetR/AcrR family transcriptional regulator [Kitasatospora sp. NPDC056327]|uniref:TetR/AcrR family transcriptional regulator n=1 Tax=Kitasatospora sp. NPDC056327 TaxID=3345785 RepID=UPI0035DBD652